MSESAPQLPPPAFVLGGFDSPNTTQVPDAFFDVVAPQLTEAELRVALYIIRRTFGFKKDSDTISLRQMVEGIVTKDGRIRADGVLEHDMYLAQVKTPAESKGAWDYYKILRTIPGKEAFQPLAESTCPLLKKPS